MTAEVAATEGGAASRSGAEILVDCLRRQAVDRVFCVPGESYLAVLDALHGVADEVQLVVCRQEGGAANMADAYGKLTGRPGVCFVTRGPGATNASIGVHTAFQDSTPMVLFIGQVARGFKDREGFQEVDLVAMFRPLAKWAAEIDDPRRIPEYIHRAFQTAMAGRPGPVVLVLPEDMLSEEVAVPPDAGLRADPLAAAPRPDQIAAFAALLTEAKRPMMILGGGGWTTDARDHLLAFAERAQLPIAASLRCQDYVPNTHPLYVGHFGIGAEPQLVKRLGEADLVVAFGTRLGEMTTAGYRLLTVPRTRQKLVHIHADPEELGRVYQADLPINAGLAPFAAAVAVLDATAGAADRQDWVRSLKAEHDATYAPLSNAGDLDLTAVFQHLQEVLPSDTIVSNGAGNYTGWVHKYWRFSAFRSQLAPTSGAMGYGVPAAVAAKLTYPGRTVLSVNGDGCFLMNGQEMATAVQYGAPIIYLVVNNGMYGTIRMHQEREYPTRVSGTELHNPDFAMLARSYGLAGHRVERTEDFAQALEAVLASPSGGLIELIVPQEALSVRSSLSQLRSAALKRQAAQTTTATVPGSNQGNR
ncbi:MULTISPECIES: thiamine pyrophosphate-binding protein [unclassified Chelatococcus]|uniref:thiamine pyrophosphate-binding protein n=1 Tax=unclassified Chelatococcus TaxID=2638111 RepID=UPI001BCFF2D9|nr:MULTISPECIES: thiamine pyrophosphate-binding protein [unclassified Chelatococcus]MBS7701011.1 thiamine pyrophosphate-binding protein [Chelatococcus sp. YT9]MBX3555544.1 thiamine pyrophosphate-binding protein [Chelatococcus sp.]